MSNFHVSMQDMCYYTMVTSFTMSHLPCCRVLVRDCTKYLPDGKETDVEITLVKIKCQIGQIVSKLY